MNTLTRSTSEIVREIFEAIFIEHDLSDPSRYWTDESVDHVIALGESVHGKDALADFFRELFASFPDWTLQIEQIVDDGGRRAVVQWIVNATFTGADWQGVEATGSHVTVRGVDVIKLDDTGRIAENSVYYDGLRFARQLGMLPRQGSTADRAMLAVFNVVTTIKERLCGSPADHRHDEVDA